MQQTHMIGRKQTRGETLNDPTHPELTLSRPTVHDVWTPNRWPPATPDNSIDGYNPTSQHQHTSQGAGGHLRQHRRSHFPPRTGGNMTGRWLVRRVRVKRTDEVCSVFLQLRLELSSRIILVHIFRVPGPRTREHRVNLGGAPQAQNVDRRVARLGPGLEWGRDNLLFPVLCSFSLGIVPCHRAHLQKIAFTQGKGSSATSSRAAKHRGPDASLSPAARSTYFDEPPGATRALSASMRSLSLKLKSVPRLVTKSRSALSLNVGLRNCSSCCVCASSRAICAPPLADCMVPFQAEVRPLGFTAQRAFTRVLCL